MILGQDGVRYGDDNGFPADNNAYFFILSRSGGYCFAKGITWLGFSRTYFELVRTEPLLHHVHGALCLRR